MNQRMLGRFEVLSWYVEGYYRSGPAQLLKEVTPVLRVVHYLIIDAGGDARIIKRKPNSLHWNEVAYELIVSVPEGWGQIAGKIHVELPNPADLAASVWMPERPVTPPLEEGAEDEGRLSNPVAVISGAGGEVEERLSS